VDTGSSSAATNAVPGRLVARLPPALRGLARLAYNCWWSWQPGGEAIFRDIDPRRWEACAGNPVRLLIETDRLAEAAADDALVSRIAALERALSQELSRPFTLAGRAGPAHPIAFFCAEYGLHPSLPIYAGGLGALAGDFLKEASDRALPVVGVGLLYHRGYFHQRLDPSGWQHEYWTISRPEDLPVVPVLAPDRTPLTISVPLRGERIRARVVRAQVGRIPLYLLDADVEDNSPIARWISAQLYVGDREMRLMQYALLGIGGARVLDAMGIEPSVFHLNEGHASLLPIALLAAELRGGRSLAAALQRVRDRVVFTTHTPVDAGNETYGRDEVERILGGALAELGIGLEEVVALGRSVHHGEQRVGLTELALRTSRSANAVSRRHGEVARAMWQPLYAPSPAQAVPIGHVTNGVHLATWMAAPMRELLARYLGKGWESEATDPARWEAIEAIPDEEIWTVRNEMRAALVRVARSRSMVDRLARGETLAYVAAAARAFDPDALTIGFARRVAAYKRWHLLVQDPQRAVPLLRGPRALQVVLAGKAHPRDDEAKRTIQLIFTLKAEQGVGARVVFLEDYDLSISPYLLAGSDVWVNLPRPPYEASGTSGMKAALNGSLNLSVLDGWWCEGFRPDNGWSIHSEEISDAQAQDARDARALYDLLEREIVPLFHDRDAGGVPRAWVRRIKCSLRSIGPAFCAGRMLRDYLSRVYSDDGVKPQDGKP